MIEIGGEILCSGNNNGLSWKIGIQNPFKDNEVLKIISCKSINNLLYTNSYLLAVTAAP